MSFNINGLTVNKLEAIRGINNNNQIICLQEVKKNDKEILSTIFPDYVIESSLRNESGGGIMIAVKGSQVELLEAFTNEFMVVVVI